MAANEIPIAGYGSTLSSRAELRLQKAPWSSKRPVTVGLKCGVLAIIRYNYLGVEYARRLSKCQVIGHSLEVTVVFGLLHADCLEEESFSIHVHTQDSHFPLTRCHFFLPNLKLATLVQVS
jgi:hypothetical protein